MRFGIEIECLIPHKAKDNGYSYHNHRDWIAKKMCEIGIQAKEEHYNHAVRSYWKITTDASVGESNSYGVELVSPPMEWNSETADTIKKLSDLLKSYNISVNSTCGLHVHVDVRSLKPEEIRMILSRYQKHEEKIDMFMPESRRGSSPPYCRSIKNFRFTADKAIESCISDKYFKINTRPYVRYGTIEFRHHSGTIDFDKISNWLNFIEAFIAESKKVTDDVKTILLKNRESSGTVPQKIQYISPHHARNQLAKEMLVDIFSGFRNKRNYNLMHRYVSMIKRQATAVEDGRYVYHTKEEAMRNIRVSSVSTYKRIQEYVRKAFAEAEVFKDMPGLDHENFVKCAKNPTFSQGGDFILSNRNFNRDFIMQLDLLRDALFIISSTRENIFRMPHHSWQLKSLPAKNFDIELIRNIKLPENDSLFSGISEDVKNFYDKRESTLQRLFGTRRVA